MESAAFQSAIQNPKAAIALRAFTLIEMVISLSILAIIAVAVGSTIVLASRSLEREARGGSPATTRRAMDRLLAELSAARSFSERTSTAVTFTVPDRDGDGSPETIRYAWSGTSGTAVTRQYNGGTPDAIVEDVSRFDLTYLLRTVDPPPPKEVESPEQVLIAHADAPGGTFREQAVQDKNGCGAYFKPTLPANAIRWKVTRIEFVARRPITALSTVTLSVTNANASLKPGSQVLASVNLPSMSLPLVAGWQSVSFTTLTDLDPAAGLCFTARTASTSVQGVFQYEDGGSPMTAGTHWMVFNSAVGWSGPQDLSDMRIRVWGTVTTTP